jgi:hypothetical protein
MDNESLEESLLRPTPDDLSFDINASYDYLKCYRRSRPNNPEVALCFALLNSGIDDYCRYLGDGSRRGRRLFKEAEEWFFSGDDDWYCSFSNLCAILSIEPGYVRRGLRRYYETHSSSGHKSNNRPVEKRAA